MGYFGYICKHCGTSIRYNENCVMIHLRHGKELGRVTGSYDSFGRVCEQYCLPPSLVFRGDTAGLNSHISICKSEYDYTDSWKNPFRGPEKRLYSHKYCTFYEYLRLVVLKELKSFDYNVKTMPFYSIYNSLCLPSAELTLCSDLYFSLSCTRDLDKLNSLKDSISSIIEGLILNYHSVFESLKTMYYKDFICLKRKQTNYSGIVAYHSVCYNKANKAGTFILEPSDSDPNQSSGPCRKKFM